MSHYFFFQSFQPGQALQRDSCQVVFDCMTTELTASTHVVGSSRGEKRLICGPRFHMYPKLLFPGSRIIISGAPQCSLNHLVSLQTVVKVHWVWLRLKGADGVFGAAEEEAERENGRIRGSSKVPLGTARCMYVVHLSAARETGISSHSQYDTERWTQLCLNEPLRTQNTGASSHV